MTSIRELDLRVETSRSTATAIRAALTERELEIFTQLASGNSNHQIANDLSHSPSRTQRHLLTSYASGIRGGGIYDHGDRPGRGTGRASSLKQDATDPRPPDLLLARCAFA